MVRRMHEDRVDEERGDDAGQGSVQPAVAGEPHGRDVKDASDLTRSGSQVAERQSITDSIPPMA